MTHSIATNSSVTYIESVSLNQWDGFFMTSPS